MTITFLNCSHGDEYRLLGASLSRDLRRIKSANALILVSVRLEIQDFKIVDQKLEKFALVLDLLEAKETSEGDWIVWVDSDIAIVNPDLDPTELLPRDKDLMFSSDRFGICTGVFGVRKSKWALGFLRALVLLGQTDRGRSKEFDLFAYRAEQFAIRALLRYFPDVRSHCEVFGESIIQNRMSKFSSGAWMFHFWMGRRSAPEILRKKLNLRRKGWSKALFWQTGRYDVQSASDMAQVAKKIGLAVAEIANIVREADISKPAVDDRNLNPKEADKLIRISNLGDEAIEVFQEFEHAKQWLTRPHIELDGAVPVVICVTESGYDRAFEVLRKIARDLPAKDALKGS